LQAASGIGAAYFDLSETLALSNPPAWLMNLPFDPLQFIEYLDELPFDPTGEPDFGATDRRQ